MKGSSVMSSRSGVTEMRLSDSACRSVPLGETGRGPRANAIQWPLDFGAIVWLKRVRNEWLLVRWNA